MDVRKKLVEICFQEFCMVAGDSPCGCDGCPSCGTVRNKGKRNGTANTVPFLLFLAPPNLAASCVRVRWGI